MNDTGLDNQLLELTYDELDDDRAERLRRRLDDDDEAAARYEAMAQMRQAFAVLDDPDDTISATTRADILREARLTAAATREARQRPRVARFAWRPLFVGVATIALVAFGIWLATRPPATSPDAPEAAVESNTRVVASGVEVDPEAAEIALALPDDPDPVEEPAPVVDAEPAVEPAASAARKEPNEAGDLRQARASEPLQAADAAGREQRRSDDAARPAPSKVAAQTEATSDADDADADVADAVELDVPARIANSRSAGASSGSAMGASGPAAESNVDVQQAPITGNMAEVLPPGPVDEAAALYQTGAFAEAIELLTPAIAAGNVELARAHFLRGMSHKKLGDNLSAIADLRVVVEQHAGFSRADEARFSLATSLEAIGDVHDARTHYDWLVARGSTFSDQALERVTALNERGGGGLGADTAPARADEKKSDERAKRKARKRSKKSGMPSLPDESSSPASNYEVLE